jgi:prepilin peptidase CpaA
MDTIDWILTNWHVRVVTLILILAAWIDGRDLKVPNWITYPMVIAGLVFSVWSGGPAGLLAGMLGVAAGLLTLLPLYAVGGMGAGDVKLMAGIGAWMGWKVTLASFCVTAIVGAVMSVCMVLWRRAAAHHTGNFFMILGEWARVRNPVVLSEIAAARKPQMFLLPYGIPICVGTIGYFLYSNML